jgi:excisionase family DNA binding protein
MERYLTVAELAEYIKLSEQTVRRYVLNKTVPYRKIHKAVRFRVSEIETWIDGGGLDGAGKAGPEDGREGDLFAGLGTGESGAAGTGTGGEAEGTGAGGQGGGTAVEENCGPSAEAGEAGPGAGYGVRAGGTAADESGGAV